MSKSKPSKAVDAEGESSKDRPDVDGGAAKSIPAQQLVSVSDRETLEENTNAAPIPRRQHVEVVLCFDTTGSMEEYTVQIRKNLQNICETVMADIPIRIGLLAVGDYESDRSKYVVAKIDLCRDVNVLVNWMINIDDTPGGRDFPEAYELALMECRGFAWSKDKRVKKAMVFVGDAIPHPPSITASKIYWRDQVQELVNMGVKIYGVQANSHEISKDFFEEVSELSGGCYLPLLRASSLPDLFMSVCYHEAGSTSFEKFKTRVIDNGRMTDTLQIAFANLVLERRLSPMIGKRNAYDWYSKDYDVTDTPTFVFNHSTLKWEGYSPVAVKRMPSALSMLRKKPTKEDKLKAKARLKAQKDEEKKRKKEDKERLKKMKKEEREREREERKANPKKKGRKKKEGKEGEEGVEGEEVGQEKEKKKRRRRKKKAEIAQEKSTEEEEGEDIAGKEKPKKKSRKKIDDNDTSEQTEGEPKDTKKKKRKKIDNEEERGQEKDDKAKAKRKKRKVDENAEITTVSKGASEEGKLKKRKRRTKAEMEQERLRKASEPKKKRGRPKKIKNSNSEISVAVTTPKRKRGRPKKVVIDVDKESNRGKENKTNSDNENEKIEKIKEEKIEKNNNAPATRKRQKINAKNLAKALKRLEEEDDEEEVLVELWDDDDTESENESENFENCENSENSENSENENDSENDEKRENECESEGEGKRER